MTTDKAGPAAVPTWLWRAVAGAFGLLLVGIAGLAAALAAGAADPARAGPLLWDFDFKGDTSRWAWTTTEGAALSVRDGALAGDFTAQGQAAWALIDAPASPAFTLEAAASQTQGTPAYGVVFGWVDQSHYSAVLINADGYVEAYRQAGSERVAWFPLQQWPHILTGGDANRVRVDVTQGQVTVRINDEWLGAFTDTPPEGSGRIGVMAAGRGAGQVVFSWVRVWAPR